ncbi:glutamate-5-semialdehyde dehydrogenase [Deinobacterium chartae]|uniref:Gamma-glutamyl phosphate reductase n=1 Tax=Deinobacterium chartae TaxID=521158 RepID=A0A841I3A0_9DEIO|nr:glutamate-5-semialdehyde dehydrogenase [Deinobacterium chartae]MBB6098395.1 glutamate-5-semialdehyde dehydrogenase [Deinobacterium chartae]
MSDVASLLQRAQQARRGLGALPRDAALEAAARRLRAQQDQILEANARDVARERERGTPEPLIDRLRLDSSRLEGICEGLRQVRALPDPLGRVQDGWTHPQGMRIERVAVPFGVVAVIYESRPNVTVDAAALILKAGSACVLRGSSSALESNRALVAALRAGLEEAGLPSDAVQLVDSADRSSVNALLTARGLVDLVIPRGGAGLIRTVVENARVPVIETGVGNCHLFVERSADLEMALEILINGKVQRPGVCNALETLLVDREIAPAFLPRAVRALRAHGVELRGDEDARTYAPGVEAASDADWDTEYLDLILAIRVVDGVEGALAHIARHGSGHSEVIVTRDLAAAQAFQDGVDAAAVYVNASSRFTDGFEFGFGAEIGISTQKLHARGPMGLRELVSYQYRVTGHGQIRGSNPQPSAAQEQA